MRELDIDLAGRRPTKLTVEMQLHADWAVTMGCGDVCPYVPTTVEDWDLPDPAGQADRGGPRDPRRDRRSASTTCDRAAARRDPLRRHRPPVPPAQAAAGAGRGVRARRAATRTSAPAPTRSSPSTRTCRSAGYVMTLARAPRARVPAGRALRRARDAGPGRGVSDDSPDLARRAAAEGLAAFALVFAGCGAIVANAALRRRARRGRDRPGLRPGDHGDGLRDRASVGRSHQPRGHHRVHADPPLPGPRGGRLHRRAARRRDRRGAGALGRVDGQARPPRSDRPDGLRGQRVPLRGWC